MQRPQLPMQPTLRRALPFCLLVFGPSLTGQQLDAPPRKAVATVVPTLAAPDPSTPAGAAWQQFLQQAGGTWWSEWCPATGTPKAIYGSGLPAGGFRDDTLEQARQHSQQLLRDRSELLGLGTSEFREVIGARMGQTWTFVYDQYFAGLPVIGGRADVRVHRAGRIPMFGSTAWPIPAGFPTTPRLSELEAARIAWQALGLAFADAPQPAGDRKPRLVIWGDALAPAPAPFFLAWEIPVSNVDRNGLGPVGRYYVDANNGAVLHYTNDRHECGFDHGDPARSGSGHAIGPALPPATGTVMAWTRTGNSATAALVNVPVAGLEINVPGVGVVVTDASGNFSANVAAPTSVTFNLNGIHDQLIAGASAPTVTTTLSPGGVANVQFLTSAASDVLAAHTTCYYWTYRVNEFSRSILGNTAQLAGADNVLPTVDIAATCNAFYTNNTINFYQAGGGCNNTAYSTVVAHEWGHGLDDRYGGISQTQGLSEGWGDIIAMYLTDQPIVGENFYTNGAFIRTGNNTTQYPPPAEVHAAGEVWMGFAWNLRDRLATTLGGRPAAIALTNTIVIGSIVANATDQPSAVREVFIADDDDGNLANGTPHSPELIFACNQHSLPYPGLPGPANDECAGAIALVNGVNGPFTTAVATTSSPAWPCGVGMNDVWFSYQAGGSGTLSVDLCGQATWDTQVQIFSGSCGALLSLGCNDDSCGLQSALSVPVTTGTYYVRVGGYNGAGGGFGLNVTGPQSGGASTTSYGTGCYLTSKAFYELFGAAGAFDLNNASMRLVRSGNTYVAQAAGTYLAPTAAATTLLLTDDSATTVLLGGSFPYIGGATSTLEVCSNGFVSAAAGNGTAFTPSAAGWLASVQPRWGTWHDFNPGAAGSGAVKFQQVGSVAYVTWDGVYDFGTANRNTWQLQFDLTTGNVTYAWQTMSGTGNALLVGYAATAPNNDLGSMDVSVALPGGFHTSAQNLSPLASSSTLPHLGSTLTLTTTNYPAGSGVGAQVLSLVQHNPGIDLTAAGMPGCFKFLEFDATIVVIPVAGQSLYSQLIPNSPALTGLPLFAQTYAFAPGANALGVIDSNGVAMVVGL